MELARHSIAQESLIANSEHLSSGPPRHVLVRAGLPQITGSLCQHARDALLPVMVSANAFAVREQGQFVRFRHPASTRFEGMDVALDSAGYVAMSRYGEYPWTIDDYLDLAGSASWTWYSAMDFCCEPEIAADKSERRVRIARTIHNLTEMNRRAANRGMRLPTPVLQGWTNEDYKLCAEELRLVDWPDLVGVGSMCRRHLHGPDGVVAIVDMLDRLLPLNVQLHLFGVKSAALDILGTHPRIASVDSMSWDYNLRRKVPVGRTQAMRADEMIAWQRSQATRAGSGVFRFQSPLLFQPERSPLDRAIDVIEGFHCGLIAAGEADWPRSSFEMQKDIYVVECLLRRYGVDAFAQPDDDEDFDLGELWACLHEEFAGEYSHMPPSRRRKSKTH